MKRIPAVRTGAMSALVALMVLMASPASAQPFSPWGAAQKIDEIAGNSTELNTAFVDGCPIQS
ncbi:MAG TPA: hypothetical protein VNN79_22495, partial [Actinomycetota bacterium]|nr:hypothetical protein [Actinomycetota bacterium]